MTFDGALVKEQGVTFGIIVVKPVVLDSPTEFEAHYNFGVQAFGNIPIILYDNKRYKGRPDIVKFLANIHSSRIPWKKYTI